jgi:hypothetical protein
MHLQFVRCDIIFRVWQPRLKVQSGSEVKGWVFKLCEPFYAQCFKRYWADFKARLLYSDKNKYVTLKCSVLNLLQLESCLWLISSVKIVPSARNVGAQKVSCIKGWGYNKTQTLHLQTGRILNRYSVGTNKNKLVSYNSDQTHIHRQTVTLLSFNFWIY